MMPSYIPMKPGLGKGKRKLSRNQIEAIEAEIKADHLPKSFDYYCPACLFQTNEFSVKCPKCGHEGLKESGRDRFREVQDDN